MFSYVPNTPEEQQEMLNALGLTSIEELFQDIPEKVRLKDRLSLPEALSEMELKEQMRLLSEKNVNAEQYRCFLGAGSYDHFIPSVVSQMLSRQEFYTSYTPYQPEISQGTLQAIFEYQTMICELTGMHTANASMYDGATALAEAAALACSATKRKEVLIAGTVHPESRDVLHTYSHYKDVNVVTVGYEDGRVDLLDLEKKISSGTAAVIVQSPNFFGLIEDLKKVSEIAHQHKALMIASVDPVSLAILRSPGELGADIVVGEGQSLGNPMSFGGPYLGFFATTKELMRKIPGRVVGETTDSAGNRGFVLTLQTREQHIRRDKATSNICSNQALNALAASIYLTLLGPKGLKKVAELCLQKAHYLYDQLLETGKFEPVFSGPFFKEFPIKSSKPVELLNKELLDEKIIGGLDLQKYYPELENGWLLAVTEKRSRQDIDKLVSKVGNLQK